MADERTRVARPEQQLGETVLSLPVRVNPVGGLAQAQGGSRVAVHRRLTSGEQRAGDCKSLAVVGRLSLPDRKAGRDDRHDQQDGHTQDAAARNRRPRRTSRASSLSSSSFLTPYIGAAIVRASIPLVDRVVPRCEPLWHPPTTVRRLNHLAKVAQ